MNTIITDVVIKLFNKLFEIHKFKYSVSHEFVDSDALVKIIVGKEILIFLGSFNSQELANDLFVLNLKFKLVKGAVGFYYKQV